MPESFLTIDTGLKSMANVPITATLDAFGALILKMTELSASISGETTLRLFCACKQNEKTNIESVRLSLFMTCDFMMFWLFIFYTSYGFHSVACCLPVPNGTFGRASHADASGQHPRPGRPRRDS